MQSQYLSEAQYVDSQTEFDALCVNLADEAQLAVDTEFVRRNTYYPQLALLQIASSDQIYLIDPQGIADWSNLMKLFQLPIRIVMHSCSEDLEVFRKSIGQLPENLFDTQIAAAYLGKGDALGYAAMVALMCDIEVDKSETQSDWSQRPLTPAQLSYAAEDVRWLLGIADDLRSELRQRTREEWVVQEIQMLKGKYLEEAAPELSWLRLKGLGRLKDIDWPLAKALCQWREERARERDKPKSWILKDAEIMAVTQSRPETRRSLENLSGVSPATAKYNGKKILEIVNAVDQMSAPAECPPPDLSGAERKLLKAMQQIISEYSDREGIAQRFIANKQELSQYILYHRKRHPIESALDRGWRGEVVGGKLRALL